MVVTTFALGVLVIYAAMIGRSRLALVGLAWIVASGVWVIWREHERDEATWGCQVLREPLWRLLGGRRGSGGEG